MRVNVSYSRTPALRVSLILLLLMATISPNWADLRLDASTTIQSYDENSQPSDVSADLPFVFITGANGLVGTNLVQELLKRGHRVRAAVLGTTNTTETSNLKSFPNAKTHLEFVDFDLKEEDPQVYKYLLRDGVEWIFHEAAPFVGFKPQPEAAEKINQSVHSIRLLLGAAQATPSVTQFVYTGSVAAVATGHDPDKYGAKHVFTEEDWSNLNGSGAITDYDQLKTLTEKQAWEYVENTPAHFRFTSLLPTFILGPSASDNVRSSQRIVYETLIGNKGVIELTMPFVDIRDVVEAHFRAAMQEGGPVRGRRRFILTRMEGGDVSLPELVGILREHFGPMGYNIPTWKVPKWIVWILSWFDSGLASLYRLMGTQVSFSNAKSREVLGITYHTNATEIILATAHAMIQKGLVPKTEGYKTYGFSWSDEL